GSGLNLKLSAFPDEHQRGNLWFIFDTLATIGREVLERGRPAQLSILSQIYRLRCAALPARSRPKPGFREERLLSWERTLPNSGPPIAPWPGCNNSSYKKSDRHVHSEPDHQKF